MRTFVIHLSDWPVVWYPRSVLEGGHMHALSKGIQVSGRQNYEENRWREAILYYLFGVWGNLQEVMYRPKIMFGGITLRLNSNGSEYYAYGPPTEEPPPIVKSPEEHLDLLDEDQWGVEIALIRFVKNNQIRQLTLRFRYGELRLWKKSQRGQYGIAAVGLPKDWSLDGPVWEYR